MEPTQNQPINPPSPSNLATEIPNEVPKEEPVVVNTQPATPRSAKTSVVMFVAVILGLAVFGFGAVTFMKYAKSSKAYQMPVQQNQTSAVSPSPVMNQQNTITPSPTVSSDPATEVKQLDSMMNNTNDNDFNTSSLNNLQ